MPNPEQLDTQVSCVTSDVPLISHTVRGQNVTCYDLFPTAQDSWTIPNPSTQQFSPPGVFYYDAIQESQKLPPAGSAWAFTPDFSYNKRLETLSNLWEYVHYNVCIKLDIRVPLGASARIKIFGIPAERTSDLTTTDHMNFPGVTLTTDGDCTHFFMMKWSANQYLTSARDPQHFGTFVIHTLETNYTSTVPIPVYFTPTVEITDCTFSVLHHNIASGSAGDFDGGRVVRLKSVETIDTRSGRASWVWNLVGVVAGLAVDFVFPGWGSLVSAGTAFVVKVVERVISKDGEESYIAKGLDFHRGTTFELSHGTYNTLRAPFEAHMIKTGGKEYFLLGEDDNPIPYAPPHSRSDPIPLLSVSLPTPQTTAIVDIARTYGQARWLFYTKDFKPGQYTTTISGAATGLEEFIGWSFFQDDTSVQVLRHAKDTTSGLETHLHNTNFPLCCKIKWNGTEYVLRDNAFSTAINDPKIPDWAQVMLVTSGTKAFLCLQPAYFENSGDAWRDFDHRDLWAVATLDGKSVVPLTFSATKKPGPEVIYEQAWTADYVLIPYCNSTPSPQHFSLDNNLVIGVTGFFNGFSSRKPIELPAEVKTYGIDVSIPHTPIPNLVLEGPDDAEGVSSPGDVIDVHKVAPQIPVDPQVAPLGKTVDHATAAGVWVPISRFTLDVNSVKGFKINPLYWNQVGVVSPSQAQISAMRHVYVGPAGNRFSEYRLTSTANAFANGRLLMVHIPPAITDDEMASFTIQQFSQFNRVEHVLHGNDSTINPQWLVPVPYIKSYDANDTNGTIAVMWVESVVSKENEQPQFTMWVRAEQLNFAHVRPPIPFRKLNFDGFSLTLPSRNPIRDARRRQERLADPLFNLKKELKRVVETSDDRGLALITGAVAVFDTATLVELFKDIGLDDLYDQFNSLLNPGSV